MKKLMLAAIAVSAIGAYADCDKPNGPTPVNCAEVYDVSMTIKTTVCKCRNTVTTTIVGNECGKDQTDKIKECIAWREITTKKVAGNIWNCECSCTEDLDVDSILEITPAWWDYETSAADATGNQYFWFTKDKTELQSTNLMTFKKLGRIGKTKTAVEAAGTFGEGINFAGFGSYDVKNARVKNISGHLAGVWGAPYDCTSEDMSNADDCPIYQLCESAKVLDDIAWTAAAGTFTVKYNASKSKKLAAGYLPVKQVKDPIPSYESITML